MGVLNIFVALIFFLTGAPGREIDLLDMVSVDSYWQAKNVTVSVEQLQADAGPEKVPENVDALLKDLQSGEFATRDKARRDLEKMGPAIIPLLQPATRSNDPEVAAIASGLVRQFTQRAQERSIRRLMAIRTLGEHKDQAALPLLKSLQDSKELFVSDYARRSVAQIEGQKLEPVSHAKEFEQDVAMMPRDTGILGQMIGEGQEALTLTTLIDEAVEAMKGAGMPQVVAGEQKVPDKKKMIATATNRILMLVEATGNMRLTGATLAVSKDVGPNGGWAVFAVRGRYNTEAVQAALKSTLSAERAAMIKSDPFPQIYLDTDSCVVLPSSDLVLFAVGPSPEAMDKGLNQVTAALKGGKGTLADNAPFVELMRTVDKKGPVWLAAITPEELKKEQQFSGLDRFTLETTRAAGSVKFTFKGHGADAEKLKATADEWKKMIEQMQAAMKQQAQQNKMLEPVAELFDSMKIAAEGNDATFTGEIKPTIRQSILMELGMGLMSLLEE